MKKNIVIILLVASALVLIAASKKQPKSPESAYDEVKSRGVLTAGIKYDFPPLSFFDENGEHAGLDAEIVRYIAGRMGVKVKFKKTTSSNKIPLLLKGDVDLLATLTHTVERDKLIDFSITCFKDGQVLLVKKDSTINSVADLKGLRTGSLRGSLAGLTLLAFQEEAVPVFFDDDNAFAALQALKAGRIDAFTTGYSFCSMAARDAELKTVGAKFTNDYLAIGVRQNDSKWLDFINLCIMQMWKDGSYEAAYSKYFGTRPDFSIEIYPGTATGHK
jgi:polar amino acid transport system substrate-binding protein